MKRRDFLKTSGIATSTPLFIDTDELLEDILGDGFLADLFGDGKKDVPIEERIGHPTPEVEVWIDEDSDDGYTVRGEVVDWHGWEVVNIYPNFDSAADQGAAQVSLSPSERETFELPADRDEAPDWLPHDIDLAFEAKYDGRNIYTHRAAYRSGDLQLDPAHEVPDYCWWEGWVSCRIDDPVADEDMETPE